MCIRDSPEESIKQGCAYFAKLLKAALDAECDVNTAVQAYNYGGKYVEYVAANGKVHTFELDVYKRQVCEKWNSFRRIKSEESF